MNGAHDFVRAFGHVLLGNGHGDTEVGQLGHSLVGHQHVMGLHVSVDYLVLMSQRQCLSDLEGIVDGFFIAESALLSDDV